MIQVVLAFLYELLHDSDHGILLGLLRAVVALCQLQVLESLIQAGRCGLVVQFNRWRTKNAVFRSLTICLITDDSHLGVGSISDVTGSFFILSFCCPLFVVVSRLG